MLQCREQTERGVVGVKWEMASVYGCVCASAYI